uniref:Neuropeptide Y prohormone-5 n=1 Tax=Schmidtea mediterranea TaxID=79327 RepID=E3CTI3_SCHMD|nr:TPA_inf: neuropeptide Y prohormone-5 [Schmidtea mediterranea]
MLIGYNCKSGIILLMAVLGAMWLSGIQTDDRVDIRKSIFSSPEALRRYLLQMNEYLAIVARPRYGKRSLPIDMNRLQFDNYENYFK